MLPTFVNTHLWIMKHLKKSVTNTDTSSCNAILRLVDKSFCEALSMKRPYIFSACPSRNFGCMASVRLSVLPLATSCLSFLVTVMVLGWKIGHTQQMTPVNVEVTRSKVKVTLAFNRKKPVSAQYLEKFIQSFFLVGRLVMVST